MVESMDERLARLEASHNRHGQHLVRQSEQMARIEEAQSKLGELLSRHGELLVRLEEAQVRHSEQSSRLEDAQSRQIKQLTRLEEEQCRQTRQLEGLGGGKKSGGKRMRTQGNAVGRGYEEEDEEDAERFHSYQDKGLEARADTQKRYSITPPSSKKNGGSVEFIAETQTPEEEMRKTSVSRREARREARKLARQEALREEGEELDEVQTEVQALGARLSELISRLDRLGRAGSR